MRKVGALLLAALFVSNGFCQERSFAHVYTAGVESKGEVEMELWHTSRIGHRDQFYHGMDQRLELELGLGGRVQTAFYLNRYQESVSDSNGIVQQKGEIGFSNEWKWQVSRDGSKTRLALYGELGVKGDEIEWEGKLILNRSFGKHLIAFNLGYEVEQEVERSNSKTELKVAGAPFELSLGYMYPLNPSLSLGIELKDRNEMSRGPWLNSALFGGPTLYYKGREFFLIANFLPQWSNLHKTEIFPHHRMLDEAEKTEIRILVGFEL